MLCSAACMLQQPAVVTHMHQLQTSVIHMRHSHMQHQHASVTDMLTFLQDMCRMSSRVFMFWPCVVGEEGPADELWESINELKVERIDHGVSCLQDPRLMQHLKETRLPLTVCPRSNYQVCSC